MQTPLNGGCACGAIRFTVGAAPLAATNCHCRACQRASGTAFSSAIVVLCASLEVKGTPVWYETRADSGNAVRRGFCATCGSPLFARSAARPDFMAVKIAALDDPNPHKPMVDIWTSSACSWAPFDPALPKFPKEPGSS